MKKISELLGKVLTTAFSGQKGKFFILSIEQLDKALEAIPLHAHSFHDFSEKSVLSIDTNKIDTRPTSKKAQCAKRWEILAKELLGNAPNNGELAPTIAILNSISKKISLSPIDHIGFSRDEMDQIWAQIIPLSMASANYVIANHETAPNITPLRRNFARGRVMDVPDRYKIIREVCHGIMRMFKEVNFEPNPTQPKAPEPHRKGTMKHRRPF